MIICRSINIILILKCYLIFLFDRYWGFPYSVPMFEYKNLGYYIIMDILFIKYLCRMYGLLDIEIPQLGHCPYTNIFDYFPLHINNIRTLQND